METKERKIRNKIHLRNGYSASIRHLNLSDRELLSHGFRNLSAEARYSRFLHPTEYLSSTMLGYLVDDVDGVNHIALVLSIDLKDHSIPVAVARMVRHPNSNNSVDVAVTVLDKYQGIGIATVLLKELVGMKPEGVSEIQTLVLSENAASVAMLRRLGPAKTEMVTTGVLEVTVDISD